MSLGDFNRVNVGYGSITGKRSCMIKRCKRRDKFFVFADDGEPMMSRLFGTSCKNHLTKVVEKAIEYNNNRRVESEKDKKRIAIDNAKKLLKTSKEEA